MAAGSRGLDGARKGPKLAPPMHGVDWSAFEGDIREQLAGLGIEVDRARVERFAAQIAAGELSAEGNRLREDPLPPLPGSVDEIEGLPDRERARLRDAGLRALRSGQVAVCVLNGGMATRFGGAVKGIVEALAGRSFLELKLAQARRFGDVPFLAMNSFATHAATQAFLAARGIARQVRTFLQSASVRLTPSGEVFRGANGRVSLYAPGHGDFPGALRDSGALDELERRGVRAILLSNVDNLGAEPDPLLVGYHLDHGRSITTETARTIPGDAGGAPARVAGRLQLVEGFRFPRGFGFEKLPYVNTNTFAFALEALRRAHPLSWFYVEKRVDGRAAVQLEHLVGELTAFEPTAYVAVPRSGPEARYFPVKAREDLDALRADPILVERFTRDIAL
jgi:UTP--glucose-1-phosphate uridylyltransferase